MTTTYSYDQGGRLKTVSMAGAQATQTRTFTYDKRGLLQSERHPEKGGIAGNGYTYYYDYDANGRAGRRVDNPWDLLFTYDRAERLASVGDRSPARPWKTFTYGTSGRANGRVTEAVRHNYHDRLALDVIITEKYFYDGVGGRVSRRRTESSTGPAFEQTFSYDARGNVTSLGYPSCAAVCTNLTQVPSVTNTYTNGYLASVTGNALGAITPGATSIAYHPNGMVASVGMNNGVTWAQGVASNGMARPASITTTGSNDNLALGGYTYDGAGNITSDGVDTFRYDRVSRLVSGTAAGMTQQVTYDSFGNIKTLGGSALSPSPTTNRLPSSLATYAVNGAVTAFGGDLFDLDPFAMIQAVHDATYTGKYWAFVYTADDERIWKYDMGAANTSWWKIRDLGGKVLSEYVNVGTAWTAVNSYIYRDGTLLGRYAPQNSNPKRWFAVDHLGTPRRTFAENGVRIDSASFFPFGGVASNTPAVEETLRYTGHERDTAIAGGVDYMHARFYGAGVGRFLSVDGGRPSPNTPQSWNRYSYVLNSPLGAVDPDGRETFKVNRGINENYALPSWAVISHTFVVTTSKGLHTMSWGNTPDGKTLGRWFLDRPEDLAAAKTALENGWTKKVGDDGLDQYVEAEFQEMYNKPNDPSNHPNCGVYNNCKDEADKLIERARAARATAEEGGLNDSIIARVWSWLTK